MSTTELVFGTQYYRPPFPNRETWSSDLNLIADSGMNTVKLWAVWSSSGPITVVAETHFRLFLINPADTCASE
jgi:hypothetical protein